MSSAWWRRVYCARATVQSMSRNGVTGHAPFATESLIFMLLTDVLRISSSYMIVEVRDLSMLSCMAYL